MSPSHQHERGVPSLRVGALHAPALLSLFPAWGDAAFPPGCPTPAQPRSPLSPGQDPAIPPHRCPHATLGETRLQRAPAQTQRAPAEHRQRGVHAGLGRVVTSPLLLGVLLIFTNWREPGRRGGFTRPFLTVGLFTQGCGNAASHEPG